MNKLLISFLLALVWSSSAAYAQIVYEQNYSAALKKSQAVKKPVFIFLVPKDSTGLTNKGGLNETETSQFYNTNFVNLKLTSVERDAIRLASLHNVRVYPGCIFISSDEKLICKTNGVKAGDKFFIDLGKEALDRLESRIALVNFDEKYASGEISRKFLKDYINLRIKTGTTNNGQLIEKYITYLTIAEFDEPGELLFIFKAGPLLTGNAYKLLYHNEKLANSILLSLPLSEGITINERIGNNTLYDAIATKNLSAAMRSASFARNTHANNYNAGDKLYTWNMMQYYKGVKDTANFFSTAGRYYDTFYMKIGLDSVKNAKRKSDSTGKFNETAHTADRLNSAAGQFYEFGAKNDAQLSKAMLWSKRAIEINPDPKYYDTLAHILYRLGFHDEAVLNQQKALKLSKLQLESKAKLAGLTLELKKMKERKL
ncbi:hypothetical protein [Pedobacter sp. GR22-6]|uniref:hypothetical protein n=1 Tax=Pedobacter sp. GR22-6 TaxID=3127957 RepID=UPI00307D6AAA